MKKCSLITKLALLGVVFSMAACDGGSSNNSTNNSSDVSNESISESSEPEFNKEDIKFDSFNYSSNFRDLNVLGGGAVASTFSQETRDINVGKPTQTTQRRWVNSNVKAFVVPVEFDEFLADDLPKGREGSWNDINEAIFGDGSHDKVAYESLSSFYDKSSHGVCDVDGICTPWFNAGSTLRFNIKDTGKSQQIARDIYEYYTTGEGAGTYDMKDFDANDDGKIDSLIMIYTHPITDTGEIWWAFRWSCGCAAPDEETPVFYDFFWASYFFFYEGYSSADIENGTALPDAHTLIHEYGHVLGLPDYYVTDYNNKDFDGVGGLDFMSFNVGDHNSISKGFYGWVEPYVVEETTTITINSTTDTGEFIIVPIKGKGFKTLLDQYMLVEFLTPTGVAAYDAEGGHRGLTDYYKGAGVRIMHVDARPGLFKYNSSKGSYEFSGFTSRIGSASGTYVDFACSNTASTSCFKDFKLFEIKPATGKSISTFSGKPQNKANDTCLYQAGDVFGETVWANYMMHDDSGKFTVDFGYTISIDAIDGNNSATITITQK